MRFKIALCITITVLFWASAFVGNKFTLAYFSPAHLALLRYIIGSMVLVALGVQQKVRLPQVKDIPRIFACGLLGISLYNLLLYYGQLSVPAGTASLLVNTAPIFTALMSVFFLKEKVNIFGWIGILVSFGGVVCIVLGRNASLGLDTGALLILGAALSFSLYFIIQKPLLAKYRSIEVVSYCIWSGTIILSPFVFTLEQNMMSIPLSVTFTVVYLGIFPGALAYFTWSVVNAHLPASISSSFLYLTPVFSMILSYFVFGEIPTVMTVSGGCIAIGGVFIVNKLGKDRIAGSSASNK